MASGPRGALALPGDYQVRLTANGKSQTAPLHLAIDPRVKEAAEGMRKSFELSVRVNERISQLHQAINEIRETRSQIDSLRKRFADNERLKPALAAADEMKKKMSAIEEKLIQVKMKSSEGNLVYPNQLNEEFYTFSRVDRSRRGADRAAAGSIQNAGRPARGAVASLGADQG